MKLSVALCTYNGERFLREQLESIAAQARAPDELVVCDDRSADGTAGIVREFAARAPFPIRLEINERNLGSARNFERAAGLCAGDVIAFCDQDDVWMAHKLARVEEVFARDESAGLVFTDAEVVDENLRPLGASLWRWTLTAEEMGMIEAGRALEVLVRRNVVTGATMAFRSSLRELALPFPEGVLIHDGWIALAVAAVARVVALHEPSVKYRQHAGQQIGVRQHGGAGASARRHTAAERAAYYAVRAEYLRLLCERLEEGRGRGAHAATDARLAEIRDLAAHYRVRGSTHLTRRQRLPLILGELRARRYQRFSKGLPSAVLDLLR